MKIIKTIGPILLTSALIALDQWTKQLAITHLMGQAARPAIPGLLSFTYHTNPGAAFGLFAGGRWFFLIFTAVVVIVMAVYYVRLPHGRLYNLIRFLLILIVAGGVGNGIDRMRTGYVVDFLRLDFVNFPIFNLADIYVVLGTFVLAFVVIFFVKDEKNE